MALEYRICWRVGIVGGEGHSDWMDWDGDEDLGEDEVTEDLGRGPIRIPDGLETALEISSFEWWAETREKATN